MCTEFATKKKCRKKKNIYANIQKPEPFEKLSHKFCDDKILFSYPVQFIWYLNDLQSLTGCQINLFYGSLYAKWLAGGV